MEHHYLSANQARTISDKNSSHKKEEYLNEVLRIIKNSAESGYVRTKKLGYYRLYIHRSSHDR